MTETTSSKRTLPAGLEEIGPLAVGVIGISIPVGLIAAACVTGSTVILVLAVLAMLAVGGGTLTFVMMLASDEPQPSDSEGLPPESPPLKPASAPPEPSHAA